MKAIIDEQLEEILTRMGAWEDFCKGTITCAKCKRAIDFTNLGLFIPRRDKEGRRIYDFFCNDPDCLNEVLDA